MSFRLSSKLNPPYVFLANKSELTDRFDPAMVLFRRRIHNFKYPMMRLRTLFSEPPQYGAGERGIDRVAVEQPRYVRITDIDEYGFLSNELGATAENVEARYMLSENDLLIARSGNTVGKSYIHKSKHAPYACFYAGYLIRFRFDSSMVSPDYVFALTQLPYYRQWVRAIQRPAGQPNINAQEYASFQIPLANGTVQAKVIHLLNNAYDQKRKVDHEAERLLIGIDDLLLSGLGIKLNQEPSDGIEKRMFRRKFLEITGKRFDPIANQPRIKRLVEAINNGRFPTSQLGQLVRLPKSIVGDISPNDTYVGLENIDGSTGKYQRTEDKESISSALQFKSNDILFPKLRPYLNKTHLAQFDGICTTEFHIMRTKDILPAYLCNFLRSKAVVRITSLLMTGNTLPRLQLDDILALPIPIPPKNVQIDLIKKADDVRKQAFAMIDRALQELERSKSDIEKVI